MIALEVVFLTVFWLWFFTAALFLRNTLLPRTPITVEPQSFGLPAKQIQFPATDGLKLEGWAASGDPDWPWIILCHGLGSNRADLLDIAAGLHKAGFNTLLFDFRAHGNSQGRATSFGFTEQRDLEGALTWLGKQPEFPAQPYGIYGISMGGAVAIMTAARDERLKAVIADSPYANLDESIARHMALLYPWLPKQPFLTFMRLTYRLRFGIWPSQVAPEKAAQALKGRHLMVIAGGADPRMPPDEVRKIAGESGAKLWVIEHAGHLEGFGINPQAYMKEVTAFFRQSLAQE